jgi:outer membrane protein OmpA-like peptidoglycan-associated protein
MRREWMFLISCTIAAGCATPVPRELVDARAAYARASRGSAAQVAPADLHKAEEALFKAEAAFTNGSDETSDLAYVAERKAELAETLASQSMYHAQVEQLRASYEKRLGQVARDAKGQLIAAKEQLTAAQKNQQATEQQLSQEQVARFDAEEKAAAATEQMKKMEDALAKLAAVKEEPRGLVITLSGSVLFPSNQATLLPEAQTRLQQVADALLATRERDIMIEGHTDSRGSDDHNQVLSQQRAEAVRSFLVSRGYEPDRIRAQGFGKVRPVAENSSPEGRAMNRRVEIVVPNPSPSVSR